MPLDLRRRFGDVALCGAINAPDTPSIIRFFHPSYGITPISPSVLPPIRDALISLPAFDDGGIHYDTAHTTCGILAGNRWDGYFSLDRDGSTRVQPPSDGILRERAYFFCLPTSSDLETSTDPYPIVGSFKDWRFPHHNLPPSWESLRARFHSGPHVTAKRCVFTDCGLSLDAAHLVPLKQAEWYDDNGMGDYGKASSFSTDAVNASTNIVPLRTDIHRMFDERNFCFVPKMDTRVEESLTIRDPEQDEIDAHTDNATNRRLAMNDNKHRGYTEDLHTQRASSSASKNPQSAPDDIIIVGHVFNSIPGGELQKLWHNREVFPGVYAASLECLFARFAWTVFSPNIFRDFLFMSKESRSLLVWDDDSGQYRTEIRDPAKCKLTLRAAKARSESPTKRQRQTNGDGQDEEAWEFSPPPLDPDFHGSSDMDVSFTDDSHEDLGGFGFYEYLADEEEPERGRSRKRKLLETEWGAFQMDKQNGEAKRVNTLFPAGKN